MQSAWEKLTDGRCNWDLQEGEPNKPLTARQLKESAKRSMQGAKRKFAKAAALTSAGLTKDSRKLSDRWDKREKTNTTGFYNQKTARAVKRGDYA